MREYVNELKEVLDGLNLRKIRHVVDALNAQRNISHEIVFTCGNGGSASTASHLACDLSKNITFPLNVVCLNDNMASLTAWANDDHYSTIFSSQLNRFHSQLMGTLIAISTSGRSNNVCEAAKYAKMFNVPVIALTGNDGGELGKIADIEIRVPSDRIQIIEDVHLSICHMIAVGLGA